MHRYCHTCLHGIALELKVDDKSEGTVRIHSECNSLCGERATIKVQSSSVLLVKLEGTVLMATLLGTVVTVLVAWTKFRYEIGSLSFGTKSVGAYNYAFPYVIGRYDR